MADDRRLQGQIWIGKEQPNVLKYYAHDREYWTVSATTHTAASGQNIKKGQLLAVDDTSGGGGYVRAAEWPKDASSVVGMALNSAAGLEDVRILNYGYVEFNEADLDALFAAPSDLIVDDAATTPASTLAALSGGNDWTNATTGSGVGQPLYWFTGRMIKSGASTFAWVDPSTYAGKLTFATPTGHKPAHDTIPWGENSFNINYKQLPKIGTVVQYTTNSVTHKIESLVVHINFSTFPSKIQFEYPAVGLGHYDTVNTEEVIIVRHGLFPNSTLFIPHVDIRMWGYDDEVETISAGEAFNIHPGFDSYIGSGTDKRTEIELLSDTTFYYKVSAEVHYNF